MRRRHLRIKIIFAEQNKWQFPNHGQIKRFKEYALVDRALAKIGERDMILLLQLSG